MNPQKTLVNETKLIEDLTFFIKDCLIADFVVENNSIQLLFYNGERFTINIISHK